MDIKIENALPAGYLLRDYRIAKTLGGGGFSIVYLAYDNANQRSVVIKEYLPSTQARRRDDTTVETLSAETSVTFRQGIKRFFDEAGALAKINHPSIVRVIDFFRDNNTVYIVMNYEQGKDLRWYVKRHGGRMSEKFMRTVFPPLLQGLRELHSHNLLHLDVKPANVFLRPGGNPLLIDFGAAQPAYAGNRAVAAHTLTPGYAPLEQHRHGHLGPWTDLYGIGATMWTCMSGKSPPPALKRADKDTYKPALRAYSRHYSRELLEAVDWCMQMDQMARPQTAQELLDALNRAPAEIVEPPGLLSRLKLVLAKK